MINIRRMIFGVVLVCALVGLGYSGTTAVSYQVSDSADDGFAWNSAEQDVNAWHLVIGDDRDYSAPYYMSAMRFTNVAVPRSAVIVDAHLKIKSLNEGIRGQIYGVIQAESADDADDFVSRYIADANKTAASVDWDHKFNWSAHTWYTSDNISNVVQEVVNRTGWISGNSIAIYYSTRADSDKSRMFGSFDLASGSAAVLEITYETYSISGYVLDTNRVPFEGINLSAGIDIEGTVTDSNGYYMLLVPLGWSGTVTPSRAGWGFVPLSRSYNNVSSDQMNQDYTGFQPRISGYVRDGDGFGLGGVSLSANNSGGSDITDVNGYYEITVPYDWSGTVTPSKVGWGFSPVSRAYSNMTSDQASQDYGAFQPRISGYVTDGGSGLAGVFVSADNGGGSDTTDPNGRYEITVPYDWSGTVTLAKTGWGFSPVNRAYSNVKSNQINQDYIAFQPKISGYVTDTNGFGVDGVSVSADNGGGSDITDVNGYYELIVPYEWSGTVRLSKGGWGFNPFERTYANVTEDHSGEDYIGHSHAYTSGSGITEDPYLISDANELNVIGLNFMHWDNHFKLVGDIDLSGFTGTSFNIIGNSNVGFSGVFDGNGHEILNFTYSSIGSDYIGLFAAIEGEVRDLGLVNPNVDAGAGDFVGALSGKLDGGTVTKCFIEGGSVSGDYFVGGLIGGASNGGWVSKCYSSSSVSGEVSVGGLVGSKLGTLIIDCYTQGDVLGTTNVGGLAGTNESGSISKCYAAAVVLGGSNVGGLVGSEIPGLAWTSNSFWDINVSGQTTSAGGTGKTTTEMWSKITFSSAGWDFTTPVWKICDGGGYARLFWEEGGYGGGCGTELDPYLIYTGKQMNEIGANSSNWDAHFELMADIDLSAYSGEQFNVIGWYEWGPENPFSGVFDGDGHIIRNFTFTYVAPNQKYIGIFGYVNHPDAVIKDLIVIDPNVDGGENGVSVGSLVGVLRDGTISNCHVEGGIVSSGASWPVGGLMGTSSGDVLNCSGRTRVSGGWWVGGLVGRIKDGTFKNCYSTGTVCGGSDAGGLAGDNSGDMLECYARGSVNGHHYVGGLVGENLEALGNIGRISGCYSSASVIATGFDIGGLIGRNLRGVVSDSFATGSVFGDADVGGLGGINWNGTISKCYSIGSVSGLSGISSVGGFLGRNLEGPILGCFWDVEASGQTNSWAGTGLTTVEMQTESTFTDAGWDFVGEVINGPNDIWDICEGMNYPKFVWQIPVGDFICPDGVTFVDYSVLGAAWLSEAGLANWDPNCDISEPNDDVIDEHDLAVFTKNWLAGK